MDRIGAELSESPATSADDTNTGSGEHLLFFDSSLQRWADIFRDDSFTTDVSSQGVTAWSVSYDAAALHIDLLTSRPTRYSQS